MSLFYFLSYLTTSTANPLETPIMDSTNSNASGGVPDSPQAPQMMLLDFFFPGFSTVAAAIQKYLHIDLNIYIPLVIMCGALTLAWNYSSQYFWDQVETHFMSTVDIRTDDEIYNILMAWVAAQRFSQGARRFVRTTSNLCPEVAKTNFKLYRW